MQIRGDGIFSPVIRIIVVIFQHEYPPVGRGALENSPIVTLANSFTGEVDNFLIYGHKVRWDMRIVINTCIFVLDF